MKRKLLTREEWIRFQYASSIDRFTLVIALFSWIQSRDYQGGSNLLQLISLNSQVKNTNACDLIWFVPTLKQIVKNKQEMFELQITNTKETIDQLRNSHSTLTDDAQHREGSNTTENDVVENEMYLQLMAVNRNWEIPRDRLTITEQKLGRGEFGIVNKGIYLRTDGNELPVAVKRLRGRYILL